MFASTFPSSSRRVENNQLCRWFTRVPSLVFTNILITFRSDIKTLQSQRAWIEFRGAPRDVSMRAAVSRASKCRVFLAQPRQTRRTPPPHFSVRLTSPSACVLTRHRPPHHSVPVNHVADPPTKCPLAHENGAPRAPADGTYAAAQGARVVRDALPRGPRLLAVRHSARHV